MISSVAAASPMLRMEPNSGLVAAPRPPHGHREQGHADDRDDGSGGDRREETEQLGEEGRYQERDGAGDDQRPEDGA